MSDGVKTANFKNTPANGPSIILASRLYRLNNKPEDLQLAKKRQLRKQRI
jgi:predicted alpha-1,6-mannanase (GH76 family)